MAAAEATIFCSTPKFDRSKEYCIMKSSLEVLLFQSDFSIYFDRDFLTHRQGMKGFVS